MYDISLIFPKNNFLINPNVFPPLGILYLSSFLKEKGYKVQCLDLNLKKLDKSQILSNVIGISFTTPQFEEARYLLEYYKSLGKIVIAGGPHPTHRKKECLDSGFDYVITGYGETKLFNLLNKIYNKKNNNIYYYDFSYIPFPDRDALPIKAYKYYIDEEFSTTIMASRGCLFNCKFCARIDKKFYPLKEIRIIDEIIYVHERYGYKGFMIFDDCFISNKYKLLKISSFFKDKHFKFRCFGRTNLINKEICQYIKNMGVVEVGLGVESGSNIILNNILKRTNRKINTQAINLLKDFGIRSKAFLIVGLPGETKETIEETIQWIEEAKPYDIDVSIFQPMPGSDIFKNPEKYDIEFTYNPKSLWYKGIPGQYVSNVRTKDLSSEEIVYYRDLIEKTYKNKDFLK